MKRLAVWCCAALLLLLPCRALDALSERVGLDRLTAAGRSYGAGVDFSEGLTLDDGADVLSRRVRSELPPLLRDAAASALAVLAVVLLCAMAQSAGGIGGPMATQTPLLAGALALAAVCAGQMNSMIGLGRETIHSLSAFGQTLLPVMAACAAAGGHVTAAAARQLATTAFADLLLGAVDRLLSPLVYAFLAACTAFAALGNRGLEQVAKLIRWAVVTLLSVMLITFTIYLTVSGAIAGKADAAAVKAARTAIATTVPVVGRILSDAAETVLVSAGMLKGAVGAFGMITVLAICLTPFLRLGVHYLIYKLCAAVAATVADGRLAGLVDDVGTAFGLILGMTGACAVLFLISVVTGILGGAG